MASVSIAVMAQGKTALSNCDTWCVELQSGRFILSIVLMISHQWRWRLHGAPRSISAGLGA